MLVKQFSTVHHLEHGKGKVVTLTPKMKDQLVMCYFPSAKCHEWVLLSALVTDTDEFISLKPLRKETRKGKGDDPLTQVLSSILGDR